MTATHRRGLGAVSRKPLRGNSHNPARHILLLVVVCLSAIQCGRASTAPSPEQLPFIGSWSGTVHDPDWGVGSISLTVRQSQDGFFHTGNWSATFPQSSRSEGGLLRAVVQQSRRNFIFELRGNECTSEIIAGPTLWVVTTTVANNRMTGIYQVLRCTATIPEGTVDLIKK